MKTNKVKVLVLVLAVLVAVAAVLHLNTRKAVAEGSLSVTVKGTETTLDISKFAYEQVTGTRMNGKGETIQVDAQGVALKQVLAMAKASDYETVTIYSEDSYNAVVTAEEVEDGTKAFLIVEEDDDENELRLVVFGDTNSKRSVSDVAQIVVE